MDGSLRGEFDFLAVRAPAGVTREKRGTARGGGPRRWDRRGDKG